jgi:four helix bundle protein
MSICSEMDIYVFIKKGIRDRDIIQNIKRAGRSTTRNIAEGFGRYQYKENRQYCRISLGSLNEILDDLNILEDEKFCKNEDLAQGRTLVFQALKSAHGYINYLATKI